MDLENKAEIVYNAKMDANHAKMILTNAMIVYKATIQLLEKENMSIVLVAHQTAFLVLPISMA